MSQASQNIASATTENKGADADTTMGRAMRDIAEGEGDLTRRLAVQNKDEFGELASAFNRFVERIHTSIREVSSATQQVNEVAARVLAASNSSMANSDEQASRTNSVAAAINELGAAAQEIARNAGSAASASHGARVEALQAREVVRGSISHIESMSDDIGTASGAVGELARQVASIDQVLAVIRGVSEQTNLLALNAAIEAARAGEMGRGFAVVADEVRTLARRTQLSTDEIQSMIAGLKQGAENAVASMHKGQAATGTGVASSQRTGRSLEAITEQVNRISDMNHQVAAATEEQSAVTEEINRNVNDINDLVIQVSAAAEQTAVTSRELARLADHQQQLVSRFKVG